MTSETVWQLFNATSSIVHYFSATSGLKLELQSKTINSGENWQYLSHATSKFTGDFKKTLGHLICATLCFAHHLIAIGEIKLELRSPSGHFGSLSVTFLSRATWKFEG